MLPRMGEPSSAHPGPREYASAFVIWYLRAATVVNLLGAVWISFGRDLKRHNDGDFFTPHLVAPGFTGALFVAVLAVTMRRRKRAAWILNLAMGALVLALYTAVMATFPELRAHAFDWLSWSLTALFVLCLLVGRREFPAKGDRANPGWRWPSPSAGCW